MKNTSSEKRRKMNSKTPNLLDKWNGYPEVGLLPFLRFRNFYATQYLLFQTGQISFTEKKPLGKILLKLNVKLDGDVIVNFEPGEYMRMFFQSVTQAARKKKVFPIKVKPITFWLLESRICTNNQKVACVQTPPPPSPQEKSENAVSQSKILLRVFLRRGEACTQATRRSFGLSPIGSTQIFSFKLPVSLTTKQTSSSLWTLCHIGSYHGTKIPWEQTNSSLFTDAEDLLTASERGLVWGKRLPSPWASWLCAVDAFRVTWSERAVRLGYITEVHWAKD